MIKSDFEVFFSGGICVNDSNDDNDDNDGRCQYDRHHIGCWMGVSLYV